MTFPSAGFFLCKKRRQFQPCKIVTKSTDNVTDLGQTLNLQRLLHFSLLACKLHSNRAVSSFSMLQTPVLLVCHRTVAQERIFFPLNEGTTLSPLFKLLFKELACQAKWFQINKYLPSFSHTSVPHWVEPHGWESAAQEKSSLPSRLC